ncbi:MAG: hypothetical protein HS115_07680 [Spirochaetales bacterium]|nr:hypothetical protein [Spirochaetales bacterium]
MRNTILSLILLPGLLMAQDEPESSISIDQAIVSNYVWRGADQYPEYARQKGRKLGSHTGALSYQPSLTFNPPSSGLSFNIWGNYALEGRSDRDMDRVLQTSPGGDDIWAGRYSSDLDASFRHYDVDADGNPNGTMDLYDAAIHAARQRVDGSGLAGACTELSEGGDCPWLGLPGLYKEPVGTKRKDEIDLTLSYDFETVQGNYRFGIVRYMHPGPFNQETFFLDEFFFGYAPAIFPDISLTVWASTSQWFTTLAYDPSFSLTGDEDGPSVGLLLATSYRVQTRRQGWSNSDVGVNFSSGGFSLAVNATYRHSCAPYDDDLNTDLPLHWQGGSSDRDCMVRDFSQTDGLLNSWKNTVIQNEVRTALGNALHPDNFLAKNYTYVPRQKIPPILYWVSLGYSMEI